MRFHIQCVPTRHAHGLLLINYYEHNTAVIDTAFFFYDKIINVKQARTSRRQWRGCCTIGIGFNIFAYSYEFEIAWVN